MSHFGRSGPPDIRDTFSLLVLNISFRELDLTLAPSAPPRAPSLIASFSRSSSSASQAPRPTTSSRSSSATARSSTSSSRGTGGEASV